MPLYYVKISFHIMLSFSFSSLFVISKVCSLMSSHGSKMLSRDLAVNSMYRHAPRVYVDGAAAMSCTAPLQLWLSAARALRGSASCPRRRSRLEPEAGAITPPDHEAEPVAVKSSREITTLIDLLDWPDHGSLSARILWTH